MCDELISRLERYSEQCISERLDADFARAVSEVKETLKAAKNELCLHCGRYKKAHLGNCDGCRWRVNNE